MEKCDHVFGMYIPAVGHIDNVGIEYIINEDCEDESEDNLDFAEFAYCPSCGVELKHIELPKGENDDIS